MQISISSVLSETVCAILATAEWICTVWMSRGYVQTLCIGFVKALWVIRKISCRKMDHYVEGTSGIIHVIECFIIYIED